MLPNEHNIGHSSQEYILSINQLAKVYEHHRECHNKNPAFKPLLTMHWTQLQRVITYSHRPMLAADSTTDKE